MTAVLRASAFRLSVAYKTGPMHTPKVAVPRNNNTENFRGSDQPKLQNAATVNHSSSSATKLELFFGNQARSSASSKVRISSPRGLLGRLSWNFHSCKETTQPNQLVH